MLLLCTYHIKSVLLCPNTFYGILYKHNRLGSTGLLIQYVFFIYDFCANGVIVDTERIFRVCNNCTLCGQSFGDCVLIKEMAATRTNCSALRALAVEYKSLQEEPVEGFCVKLVNDDNLFEWEVAIFGPPDTLYMGGCFKARMKFPQDYPYSPPTIRFLTKVWHPNVYENGDLCISILHPPVDDPQSGELPCERWNPTQNVRTILLSVISLLNEPNTFSPANVDASVMYRRWRDSKGRDKEYENIIRKQAMAARAEAERDGIQVPLTLEDYCIKTQVKPNTSDSQVEMTDFYDDDYDEEYDDPTDGSDYEEDENDSGNGES